jgi:hypothetical protein
MTSTLLIAASVAALIALLVIIMRGRRDANRRWNAYYASAIADELKDGPES